MIENRPIVAITIGYIIGIIMGLYCKISIVFLYIIGFFIYKIIFIICPKRRKVDIKRFKLISFRRYFRYIKIIITKKVFIIILISAFLSNSVTLYKNKQYEIMQNIFDKKETHIEVIIKSNAIKKKYKDIYKAKIIKGKYKNQSVYLNINKKTIVNYGDRVELKGIFTRPQKRKNYKAFDYNEYLKTLGICGTINVKNINKIEKNKFSISKYCNSIFLKIKELIQKNFEEDVSNVLLGITLGYTEEIDEETKNNFSNSNISHILAVSGMHVGYIMLFCTAIFVKTIGKRSSNIFCIIILIFYMFLTGLSPSVVRAGVMAILMLISKIIYKKSDVFTNISLSLLILIIYNPFLIQNTGLVLSYVGTLGIIIYSKKFRVKNKVLELINITLIVTLIILPLISTYFNKIPIFSLLISIIIGFIVAPIIIMSFLFIVLNETVISKLLKIILTNSVRFLMKIANFGSNVPLGKIKIITPNILSIFIYYLIFFIGLFLFSIYKSKKTKSAFNIRVKNLVNLLKYRFNQNRNRVISIILIFLIFFSIFKIFPKNLKIYFIDVGQGDSCLIVTPKNKKILIDGGGSENYDVGKNILVPYLLDRGVSSIDWVIISHFDTDHVGGLFTVMEELKVKRVLISKQGEDSENYRKFKEIVKQKKIKIQVVNKGDKLQIEKDLYFYFLWPNNQNLISENALNNNSIVCKLYYKNFSMLFTGDIEEIAENQVLREYDNNLKILESSILKVGHHGSKTSSTQKFIEKVRPKIALIGVGENNKFGHPNDEVIKRLEDIGSKIYRTDQMGEITITINNKGKVKTDEFL